MSSTTIHMTLKELTQLLQGTLQGDPDHKISGVADLDTATATDASFVAHERYQKKMAASKAGVILLSPQIKNSTNHNVILCENPAKAFEILVQKFHGQQQKKSGFTKIHPTAVIHETATVHPSATLHPCVVVDEGATIGENSFIGAGSYIGPYVKIGANCTIHPRVTLFARTEVGDRVILHSGVVAGQDGFGYTQTVKGEHIHVPHYGNTIIGSDVEIGPNSTVACARFQSTIVGEGTKIDALVLVGHNVRIGRYSIFVGHSALAGSTRFGDHVMVGGKVAVDGHLEIAPGVMIRSWSGVTKSLYEPGPYGGMPVQPLHKERRHQIHLRRIEELFDRVKRLEEGGHNQVEQLDS